MIGIYKITNLVNGKIYIGQSIHIETRIKEHFWKSELQKDRSYNSALHQAIRKYGKENFVWEVVTECSVDEIDELEQKYIKEYNSLSPNGYNILIGGQKNRIMPRYCKLCNNQIGKGAIYCVDCGHKIQQKCERPSREELKNLIRTLPFTQIGKQYGVSDNAIRKWCIAENLPNKARDIKTYSDEEWKQI